MSLKLYCVNTPELSTDSLNSFDSAFRPEQPLKVIALNDNAAIFTILFFNFYTPNLSAC